MAKKTAILIAIIFCSVCLLSFFLISIRFPRPKYREIDESGIEPALVYSIIKAESNFNETAVSRAGAVGFMQILPTTAQFICKKEGLIYHEERLFDAEYNIFVCCRYLKYLYTRFSNEDCVIAAYNAGEGNVADWLDNRLYSDDGITLLRIPYPETDAYVKKIKKFRKIYRIFL